MSMADSHTFARPFGATVCICRDYAVRVFGKLLKQASWIGAYDKLEDTAAAFAWLQPSFLVVLSMNQPLWPGEIRASFRAYCCHCCCESHYTKKHQRNPLHRTYHLMSTDWVRLLYYKRNEMSSTIALMAGRRSADDV